MKLSELMQAIRNWQEGDDYLRIDYNLCKYHSLEKYRRPYLQHYGVFLNEKDEVTCLTHDIYSPEYEYRDVDDEPCNGSTLEDAYHHMLNFAEFEGYRYDNLWLLYRFNYETPCFANTVLEDKHAYYDFLAVGETDKPDVLDWYTLTRWFDFLMFGYCIDWFKANM